MKYLKGILEWVRINKILALLIVSVAANVYLGKWLKETYDMMIVEKDKNDQKKMQDNDILKDVLTITKSFITLKDSCNEKRN